MDTFVSDYQPVFDRIKITPKVGFKDAISLILVKVMSFQAYDIFYVILDLNLNVKHHLKNQKS